MIMKKNTMNQMEKKEEKKEESVFYTIADRYNSFCRQANIDSGNIPADDKYILGWFSY